MLSAFAAEYAALVNFVALLEREQQMLVENHTDQLQELSEKKTADAMRLSGIAEARHSMIEKNLPQLAGRDTSKLDSWLAKHSQKGLAVWQEIRALTKRAQQLNRTNGELIQMKLRHNQQSLAVLTGTVNKPNLYGPNGQSSFSAGSGRTLGSG